MSLKDGLFGKTVRKGLQGGVERLEQLERSLRGRLVIETQTASYGGPNGHALGPDEEWSRKFMNQGIGPTLELPPLRPAMTSFRTDLLQPQVLAKRVAGPAKAEGPIGRAVGKYVEPRRSLFARLFGRR